VSGRIVRELARRTRELREAGAGALLVDVTDNRGGLSWYRSAARIFSSRPQPPFRAALVKGRYTAESLQESRQAISRYLRKLDLTPSDRAVLEAAICRLDDLIAEAEHPCESGAIWTGEPWHLGCSRLTSRPYFASGVFESDPGGKFPFAVA